MSSCFLAFICHQPVGMRLASQSSNGGEEGLESEGSLGNKASGEDEEDVWAKMKTIREKPPNKSKDIKMF